MLAVAGQHLALYGADRELQPILQKGSELRVCVGEGGIALTERPDGPGGPIAGAGVRRIRQFDRLGEQATRLADGPDPGRAVRELIATLIETSSTKLTLISLVGENGQLPPAVQEATNRVQAAIGGVLAQAKNEGAVAGDVTVEEFFVLVRGVGQAAATLPAAPVTLDRAIEIICRGLAPAR